LNEFVTSGSELRRNNQSSGSFREASEVGSSLETTNHGSLGRSHIVGATPLAEKFPNWMVSEIFVFEVRADSTAALK